MSPSTLNPRVFELPVEMTHAILDFLPLSCVLELSTQSSRVSSILLSSPTWCSLYTSSARLELFQKLYYLILDIHTLYCPTPFIHGEWKTSPEVTLTYRWYAVRNWMRRVDPVIDLFASMDECVVGALRTLAFTSRPGALESSPIGNCRTRKSQRSKSCVRWLKWNRGSDDSVKSGVGVERFRVYIGTLKSVQERENVSESRNLRKLAGLLKKCVKEVDALAGEGGTPRKNLRPLIAHLWRKSKECLHRPILRPHVIHGAPDFRENALPYDIRLVFLVQTLVTMTPLLGSETTARPPVPSNDSAFSRNFACLHLDHEGFASRRELLDPEYCEYPVYNFYKVINGLGLDIPIPRFTESYKKRIEGSAAQGRKDTKDMGEELDSDEDVETEEAKDQREAAVWMAAFLRIALDFETRFATIRREVEEGYRSVDCDCDEGSCE